MTKVTIVSGFLGAGKTTLIKKLIPTAYKGEKLVLIENEFGEIGIDGGFLKEAGIQITEMNSGCICCSLVGDFGKAMEQVLEQYAPDRILIEPSGVGKLSDVIRAVQRLEAPVELAGFVTVADATKCRIYMKNFGEFYNNQIAHASAIILSRTKGMAPEKLDAAVALLRGKNEKAPIVTTPWDELTGEQLLDAMEQKNSLMAQVQALAAETAAHEHEHHHHDHDEDGECCCHEHEHEHDHEHERDHEHEHEHCHHHDHDEDGECCCHKHEHEHEHHHHGHEGHHHADEVFTSWGLETPRKFTKEKIESCLAALDTGRYGGVLRAKGIVPAEDGTWIHFDFVPEEHDVRTGAADYTGRLCVIGAKLDEDALKALFIGEARV